MIFGKENLKVDEPTQNEILKRFHEWEVLTKKLERVENCIKSLEGPIPCTAGKEWREYVIGVISGKY